MNRNGRIVGGVLIGLALLWLSGALGVFRFNNRATNQVSANTPADRPPVSDPNAIASSETSTLPPPPTGTQGFRPETGSQTTAQNNNTGTSGTTNTNTGTGSTTAGTTNTNTGTGSTTVPIRAGW